MKLRRYMVTVSAVGVYERYKFWTLKGAIEWRDRCRPYGKETKLYIFTGKYWIEIT